MISQHQIRCRQVTSHCLSQCWSISLSPYDIASWQWISQLRKCGAIGDICQWLFIVTIFFKYFIQLIQMEWCIYASVNKPSLVQTMACHLTGTKPLSEWMLEYCYLILGNKLEWNLKSYIFIQENPFENVFWKMVSIFSWSQFVKAVKFAMFEVGQEDSKLFMSLSVIGSSSNNNNTVWYLDHKLI